MLQCWVFLFILCINEHFIFCILYLSPLCPYHLLFFTLNGFLRLTNIISITEAHIYNTCTAHASTNAHHKSHSMQWELYTVNYTALQHSITCNPFVKKKKNAAAWNFQYLLIPTQHKQMSVAKFVMIIICMARGNKAKHFPHQEPQKHPISVLIAKRQGDRWEQQLQLPSQRLQDQN